MSNSCVILDCGSSSPEIVICIQESSDLFNVQTVGMYVGIDVLEPSFETVILGYSMFLSVTENCPIVSLEEVSRKDDVVDHHTAIRMVHHRVVIQVVHRHVGIRVVHCHVAIRVVHHRVVIQVVDRRVVIRAVQTDSEAYEIDRRVVIHPWNFDGAVQEDSEGCETDHLVVIRHWKNLPPASMDKAFRVARPSS